MPFEYNDENVIVSDDGNGMMRYANGDKYLGEWEKGKRHGKGTFEGADGRIAGEWEFDRLVSQESPDGISGIQPRKNTKLFIFGGVATGVIVLLSIVLISNYQSNQAIKEWSTTQASELKNTSSYYYSGGSSGVFTNKYGTSSTICAHSGCSKYIASSGDTNCCPIHSRRCLECNCYIDEDAMFCMECLQNALNQKQ